MAIYHFRAKIGSRANGQSAVASSAYRSGEKLKDEHINKTFNYRRKQAIIYSDVLLPKNAPPEYKDRATLWNAVEASEKRADSQLFREFEVSLPNECTEQEKIDLATNFAIQLAKMGMCVDYAIHDVKKGQYKKHGRANNDNAHIHFLCTIRKIDDNGKFMPKRITKDVLDELGNRIPILDKRGKQKKRKDGKRLWVREDIRTDTWGEVETLKELRVAWQNMANNVLKKYDTSINALSYDEQIRLLQAEIEATIDKKEEAELNERIQRYKDKRNASRDESATRRAGKYTGGEGEARSTTTRADVRTREYITDYSTTTNRETLETTGYAERQERINRLLADRQKEADERERAALEDSRRREEFERRKSVITEAKKSTQKRKRKSSTTDPRSGTDNKDGD